MNPLYAQFQFTLPHGERPPLSPFSPFRFLFQFTLPHGERLHAGRGRVAGAGVSIHAPAWGATLLHRAGEVDRRVSIHAPAWGATPDVARPQPTSLFQFTLPHGERLAGDFVVDGAVVFQFTLPHGERHPGEANFRTAPCFNSRSRMGSDLARGLCSMHCASFNSRSRMGSDRSAITSTSSWAGFNSRSRMGSDTARDTVDDLRDVSIHAPAWGATPDIRRMGEELRVSIHAPAWGATREHPDPQSGLQVSIHAPAWGATRGLRPGRVGPASFNSRSRMGSDHAKRVVQAFRVSIHAPAWGATSPDSSGFGIRKFQFTLPHGERPERQTWSNPRLPFQFTLPHGERPCSSRT